MGKEEEKEYRDEFHRTVVAHNVMMQNDDQG